MKKILLFALPLMVMCFVSCEKESRTPYFSQHSYKEEGYINAFGGQGYSLTTYSCAANYNSDNVIVTCDKPSWFEYTYEVSREATYINVRIDYHITESNETGESRDVTVLIQVGSGLQHKQTFTQPGITEVIVSTPGALTQELADNELLYATSLKISGELNDKDLEIIKGLRKISTLDLTDAVIDDLPDEMFYQNETIRNIKLPKSITTIHPKTFALSSLEYVYIPSNVEIIEDGEINYNYNDEPLRYTGAFANSCLSTVEFAPDSKLRHVGSCAFAGAGKERSIDDYGDMYCEKLEIVFPASVETIGAYVFRSNTHNGSYDDRFTNVSVSFEEHSRLKTIGSIGAYHLSFDAGNCTMIESFGDISDNTSFYVAMTLGTNVPPVCGSVSGGDYLYVPKGCVGAYYEADGWKEFETIKEIGQE